MISPDLYYDEIVLARDRLAGHVLQTPLIKAEFDLPHKKRIIHLKLENRQHTGSFKFRGALNKVYATIRDAPASQFVAASTGNHALGVARALEITGNEGVVFLPESVKPSKLRALKKTNLHLEFVEGTSLEAELAGKAYAIDNRATWISPYNDPLIIGGQGTIGVEILEQLPDVDRVFVTVGGGGMISGIASYVKHIRPSAEIIGCQPQNSREMYLSILAGEIVDDPLAMDTLSDGSAGPVEADAITFPICRDLVDHWMLISEADIRHAMEVMKETTGEIIEGSAGVALAAAFLSEGVGVENDVVIICGGNL